MPTSVKPISNAAALKYFKAKVPMTRKAAEGLQADAKARAFWVSGVAREDVMADMHRALLQNMRDGKSVGDFRKAAKGIAEQRGWAGLSPARLDFIYRENVNSAYQAGRYAQMRDPKVLALRPLWQYRHFPGERYPRPAHLALHNKVVPASDPWWKTWYPPNGHGCKCSVVTLSVRQAREKGLSVDEGHSLTNRVHELPDGRIVNVLTPDAGFDRSPADYWGSLGDAAAKKASATAAWKPLMGKAVAPAAFGAVRPLPDLLPHDAKAAQVYKAAGLQGTGSVVKGADGGPVLLTPKLLDSPAVRREWLPALQEVLASPDEVFVASYHQGTDVVVRRHYLRTFGEGDARVVAVAQVQGGSLVGYRVVSPDVAERYRVGKSLLNRS